MPWGSEISNVLASPCARQLERGAAGRWLRGWSFDRVEVEVRKSQRRAGFESDARQLERVGDPRQYRHGAVFRLQGPGRGHQPIEGQGRLPSEIGERQLLPPPVQLRAQCARDCRHDNSTSANNPTDAQHRLSGPRRGDYVGETFRRTRPRPRLAPAIRISISRPSPLRMRNRRWTEIP